MLAQTACSDCPAEAVVTRGEDALCMECALDRDMTRKQWADEGAPRCTPIKKKGHGKINLAEMAETILWKAR